MTEYDQLRAQLDALIGAKMYEFKNHIERLYENDHISLNTIKKTFNVTMKQLEGKDFSSDIVKYD